MASTAAVTTTGTIEAAPAPIEVAPPSKRIYMVTDSVGLGAAAAMRRAFPADWDVTVDGDAGEFTETLERKLVAARIAGSPDVIGETVIVAAGYNYPYWDPDRFDRSIDSMVATLTGAGVKHVLWVTLREVKPQYVTPAAWRQVQPYYWYFPTVNDHLERALERHPTLSLIDWAAVADQPGLTYDAIHLNPAGADLYSAIARQSVIDTTTAVGNGSVTRIAIPDSEGVEAVALNLTSVAPRADGYLTAYDCDGEVPLVSSHNHSRAQVVAHAAIVPVSASGEICVFSRVATNIVADVTGRFDSSAGITSTIPDRLVDTRENGTPQPASTPLVVDLGAAPGSTVAVSITAVGATGPGWAKIAPCGSTSTTSTVNIAGPDAVPNLAVVAVGADGTACVTASVTTHILVDHFVTFGPDSEIEVAQPERVLDTRDGGGRPAAAGAEIRLTAEQLGTEATTTGVVLNLTAVEASGPGYLTAYPCDAGRPETSNLNYAAGEVIANLVIVQPDADGDICIFTLTATHVVVDVLGTTAGGFIGGAPQRLLDTRVSP